jgi:rod shape-determining protein MreC
MESFLNRYRNITVLLLVIFAQLVLLAMQVKNDQDVRVIRVWAVTTVTPVARVVEWFRGGSIGFVRHYILLHDASEENRNLRDEVGRLRLENNFLRNELNTADRAKALQLFQSKTASKMLAANVISVGAGTNAKVVFVNRGSTEGVMRGMAVVTPDGIVGKVIAAYPTASEVMLVTDPEFSAGVVSQKSQSRGILKGQGTPMCKVDYVPFEDKIEPGEWFYTSGDDRVFPRGFAVGVAKVVHDGTPFKDILVEPSGVQRGVEDVLIILESVHQLIPDTPPAHQPVYIAPAPPASAPATPEAGAATQPAGAQPSPAAGTEADKLRQVYKSVGDAQNHTFGVGAPGSKPPDFTRLPAAPLPPGTPLPGKPLTQSNPAQPAGAAPGSTPSSAQPPAAKSAAPRGETTTAPRQPPRSAGQPTPPDSAAPANKSASPAKGPGGAPRQ